MIDPAEQWPTTTRQDIVENVHDGDRIQLYYQ
jgi:hypothetical protein